MFHHRVFSPDYAVDGEIFSSFDLANMFTRLSALIGLVGAQTRRCRLGPPPPVTDFLSYSHILLLNEPIAMVIQGEGTVNSNQNIKRALLVV
jgi:hypothetical protein